MNIIVCKDYNEMSLKAAELVVRCIETDKKPLISFPGGDTPLGMVQTFAEMVNSRHCDITKTCYVSLDEWVGLSDQDIGSCSKFNKDNLLSVLDMPFHKVHLINGTAKDMQKESEALNNFIFENGPLTVSVLGIGMNGHLGFNESGVDFTLNSHISELDHITKDVMGKYFDRDRTLTHGITQGIAQIMNAQTVILLANGTHKADIIKKALTGEISNEIPASVLQSHKNCYVILDQLAADKL